MLQGSLKEKGMVRGGNKRELGYKDGSGNCRYELCSLRIRFGDW